MQFFVALWIFDERDENKIVYCYKQIYKHLHDFENFGARNVFVILMKIFSPKLIVCHETKEKRNLDKKNG